MNIAVDQASDNQTATAMKAALDAQRNDYTGSGVVSAETRIDRLNRAIDLVYGNQDALIDAFSQDFGCRSRHQSQMSDIFATLETLKAAKKHLKKWMRNEKRKAGFPMNLFGARARVEYQPKGVIGIIGTWNFPLNTVFAPLAGAFAAGNRAMIKFSEVTPASGALMEQLIAKYFKPEELIGFNGGPDVGASFAALPFDHIIFTGATGIGRHILHAAADNLVPVTLELGGKSPVVISRSTDLKEAAVRITTGKTLNVGQVCLSPDYLFVPEESLDTFVGHCVENVSTQFPTMRDNPDYGSVVNARHQQRLLDVLEDARSKGADIREINPADEDFSQQQGSHKIPLTLVLNASDDMRILQEEIFGPLLVVKTYKALDECINYINAHDRPLALYYFGKDKAEQRQLLDHTHSGAVTINDVLAHVSCEDLPFGGIGPSGMGNYHGFDGFKTFSHARAVYKQTGPNLQVLGGMIPPYGEKAEKTLASMVKK